jgi:hypothetical protein
LLDRTDLARHSRRRTTRVRRRICEGAAFRTGAMQSLDWEWSLYHADWRNIQREAYRGD